MSRISKATDDPRRSMAADIAKDFADMDIRQKIHSGYFANKTGEELNAAIKKEYKEVYEARYYKYYSQMQSDAPIRSGVVYYKEHPSVRRYTTRHTPVNFSKSNYLILGLNGRSYCVTINAFKYPLDEDKSIETQEAFLSSWPGPLDQMADDLKRKVIDYLGDLQDHASHKRIHYTDQTNDENRKTILNLLAELLRGNGTIDALAVTKLLLRPEHTEKLIDEKPLERLKKYLLSGQRSKAVKYAKAKKLLDHAVFLALLDKYQPPNTYPKDTVRLVDDSIIQLIDEFINSLEPNGSILQVVYRSLLNRVLQCDPESLNLINKPNVENDNYEFAMLSANDCDMDFDQSNEIFKLIMAVKNLKPETPKNHLIQLGFISVASYDAADSCDDVSYRSLVTYNTQQGETPSSRTLTISNIDMMILNEIWEYCQNLACDCCNSSKYQYIINLVPYKLIFASKLLDYGLINMFGQYINSIRCALSKAEEYDKDPYYDWRTIEESVELMSSIYANLLHNPSMSPLMDSGPTSPHIDPYLPHSRPESIADAGCPPPTGYEPQSLYPYNDPGNVTSSMYHTDTPRYDNYSVGGSSNSSQYNYYQTSRTSHHNRTIPQQQVVPPQNMPFNHQPPIPEETTDFNPEPEPQQLDGYDRQQDDQRISAASNDYSNEPSRRTSLDAPVQPPQRQQAYPYPPEPEHATSRTMTSSSPVQKTSESRPPMSDSFSVWSPINLSDTNQVQPPSTYATQPNNVPTSSNNASLANEAINSPPSGLTSQNYNSNNAGSGTTTTTNNNNNINNRTSGKEPSKTNTSQQANSEQRPGLLTNVLGGVGAFFPRTNSKKEMKLPDDSDPSIQYDEAKGAWVDKSNPDASADIVNEPPPMMPVAQKVPSYSFTAHVKSAKTRYPKSQIGP